MVNILLIITDQQSADIMGNVRPADLSTPALDSIARAGVRFDSAYCTLPLCTASRASMFTGRMPSELDIDANGQPIPEPFRDQELGWLFRRAGYATAYAGKWHVPEQTMDNGHGFDVLCGMDDERAILESIKFLSQPREALFLLVTSLFQPHGCCPFHRYPDPRTCENLGLVRYGLSQRGPDDDRFHWPDDAYRASFTERCPALPENFEPAVGEPESITHKRAETRTMRPEHRPSFWVENEEHNAVRNWSTETFRHYRWAYCRLVERLDGQIGRLLEALRQSGKASETLIVFTSDHGDMLGAHRMVAKDVFYEEAIRVPLLMSVGMEGDGDMTNEALVSNGLDLLPTLCDMAGIDIPDGLHGRSLRPFLEERIPMNWRDELVLEVSAKAGGGRALHTGSMVYATYNTPGSCEELYDLENDPGEMTNLVDDPDYSDLRNTFRERLARTQRKGS